MRAGFKTILANAEDYVRFARDYRDNLEKEEDTTRLRRSWMSVIEQYNLAVGAMIKATNQGETKAWSDRLKHEQKQDQILQYARQLWNANKHDFERREKTVGRSVRIMDAISIQGSVQNLQISDLKVFSRDGAVRKLDKAQARIENGQVVDGKYPDGVFDEKPHFVELKPVLNRSVTYEVPNLELAPEERALAIANYLCEWIESKLVEAMELADSSDI